MRVLCAGICETDLQLIQGYKGFRGVLGHEFVGIAESGPFAGERVVGEINCACGRCDDLCVRISRPLPASSGIGILDHDGAFADYVSVPQRNLHGYRIRLRPKRPSSRTLSPRPSKSLPNFAQAGRPGDRAWRGPARVLCARTCSRSRAETCWWSASTRKSWRCWRAWAGRLPSRRSAARSAGGRGSGLHRICVRPAARPRAGPPARNGGPEDHLAGTQSMEWAPVVVDEITIVGSRCGPFDRALVALAERRIPVGRCCPRRSALEDGLGALTVTSRYQPSVPRGPSLARGPAPAGGQPEWNLNGLFTCRSAAGQYDRRYANANRGGGPDRHAGRRWLARSAFTVMVIG